MYILYMYKNSTGDQLPWELLLQGDSNRDY